MKKKVAIITYYWPPSGGPGVQRVLKFAKYLPQFGWEPIILTVENGEYPAVDHSLEAEINENLQVYKIKSLEFFDLFRKLTGREKGTKIETFELVKSQGQLSWKERFAQWIRINLMIPDARIGWYWKGLGKTLKIVRDVQPDLIFSSSPPHSLQLLAQKTAQRLGVKWVADFRDPWTKSFYDKGIRRWRISQYLNLRLEKHVIRKADCITSVSSGVLDLLGADHAKSSHVISNGFDEDDFRFTKHRNDTFKIVYTGHLASVQNPTRFFEAIYKVGKQLDRSLTIDFYGSVDSEILKTVANFEIDDLINFHDYIPHEEAIERMTQADLLLLFIPKINAKGILTGKLFEYLATRNFILGFGDPQGAAAKVINECSAGIMIDYDTDPTEILNTQWQKWEEGSQPEANEQAIKKYSRKNLTGELANLFNELCN